MDIMGYPPLCGQTEGVGKTRPRHVPARAPDCLQFNYDAPARHPQPMPSTQTFFYRSTYILLGAIGCTDSDLPFDLREFRGYVPTILLVVHLSNTLF